MVNKMEIMEAEKMSPQDTFRFRCDSCGKCCRNRGDILLNPHDIVRMQKYLELSLKEILDIYCEAYIGESSRVPIVRLRHAAVCVFLMHGKCLIQEAKPSVCVLYPLGRITGRKDGCKIFPAGCGMRKERPGKPCGRLAAEPGRGSRGMRMHMVQPDWRSFRFYEGLAKGSRAAEPSGGSVRIII